MEKHIFRPSRAISGDSLSSRIKQHKYRSNFIAIKFLLFEITSSPLAGASHGTDSGIYQRIRQRIVHYSFKFPSMFVLSIS